MACCIFERVITIGNPLRVNYIFLSSSLSTQQIARFVWNYAENRKVSHGTILNKFIIILAIFVICVDLQCSILMLNYAFK